MKDIIICQGSKDELEKITGRKYDYCDNDKLIEKVPGVRTTFFESYKDITIFPDADMLLQVKRWAKQVEADAIIHYTTTLYPLENGKIRGYIRGTFVQEIKTYK